MWHTFTNTRQTRQQILYALVCAMLVALGGVIPAQAATPTVGALSQGRQPARLIIPSLEIDAPIEAVEQDDESIMASPSSVEKVAWYNLGPRPGEPGNAVLAGHLDDVKGRPAVFWSLDKLAAGDEIFVRYADESEIRFEVMAVETYEADAAPMERIFGVDFNRDLNLITCDGEWNASSKLYERRLVVYARRVHDVANQAPANEISANEANVELSNDPTQSHPTPTLVIPSSIPASPRATDARQDRQQSLAAR